MINEKNRQELIMLSNDSAIWFCSTDRGIRILKGEGSMASGDVLSLIPHSIVFAERSTEDDVDDILKTMDPPLSLQTLAANIKHVYYNIGPKCQNRLQENRQKVRIEVKGAYLR